MNRRRFLQFSAAIPLLMGAWSRAQATDFDTYMQQQKQGMQALDKQWQDYKAQYDAAFRAYQAEVAKVWSAPELSDAKHWVNYDVSLQQKRVIDFERNEIRLSFTGQEAARLTEQRILESLISTLATDVQQAYRADPVLMKAMGATAPKDANALIGSRDDAQTMLNNARTETLHTSKGTVVMVVVPLAADALPQRARQYWPDAQKFAQKWQVDAALVMAIMQTESSFNPMAQSHIPAFGLMQIVPSSAGLDATKKAYGRARTLSGAELFHAPTNIELGCVYLHILDANYLKGVRHPLSRQYCVTAAYNTGAGNVARAFVGNNSVVNALPRINALSPYEVYQHLRQRLPYAETRNYLHKVTQALGQYRSD